jgi:hypothetical protein
MQRSLLVCLTALSVTTSVAAQDRVPRHAKYPRWITDYPVARALARASDQPLLVVLRCEP